MDVYGSRRYDCYMKIYTNMLNKECSTFQAKQASLLQSTNIYSDTVRCCMIMLCQ
jgi:hypothetical protein